MSACSLFCFFSLAYDWLYWCIESTYRWEIDHVVTWCSQNNLELNALKTVEMVVDYRKNSAPLAPIPVWFCSVHCGVGSRRNATCQELWWCPSTQLSLSPSFALHHRLVRCSYCQRHPLCWEGDWPQFAIYPASVRLQNTICSRLSPLEEYSFFPSAVYLINKTWVPPLKHLL